MMGNAIDGALPSAALFFAATQVPGRLYPERPGDASAHHVNLTLHPARPPLRWGPAKGGAYSAAPFSLSGTRQRFRFLRMVGLGKGLRPFNALRASPRKPP